MKRFRQVVTLFTAVTMAATLFAGCGTKTDDTSSAASNAAATSAATSTAAAVAEDPFKDPIELSVALWSIGEATVEGNDPVRDAIYKKLNLTIKPMNITWNDYKSKVMVWAASAQLPDIFAYDAIGTSTYKDWINQGIVRPIPDDMSAYPYVNTILQDKGTAVFKYPVGDANAKFYAIPRLNHMSSDDWCTDIGIQVRKDWMENVGVTKDPETMDEFTDLMAKFVSNDPDKNGKKDTIGLTMYEPANLRNIVMGYEPGFEGWVKDKENPGKWILGWMTKDCLEGLKAAKKLYDAGGMDRDFATLKGEEGQDKMATGKAGAYAHDVTPSTLYYLADKYAKANPGKKYTDVIKVLKPFKATDGKYYRQTQVPFWSETYVNAKCDDKKMDRAFRLLDYYMSDEGYNISHFGIEGTDWNKSGDTITLIPHKDATGADIPLIKTYPFIKISFLAEWSGTRQWTVPTVYPELQKMSKDLRDWELENAEAGTIDRRLSYFGTKSSDKSTYLLKDLLVKCILSKDVEKTFNSEISACLANGYDKIIQETNDAAVAAGIN